MARAQKYQSFTYTVSGSNSFPVDMLRYDRSVPLTSDDVVGMADNNQQQRQVNLIGYAPLGYKPEPTVLRWLSFGWVVLQGSVKLKTE